MDQPYSHITPGLALRSDNIPGAFSAHPDLSPATVKLLRLQYDNYLGAGDSRRATELAHLSASDEAGHIAVELNKSNRDPEDKRKYFHPTVWAELWRDQHTRRKLRRLVRHPQRQRVFAGLSLAAHDELWWRGFQLAKLLIEQVELAAGPLRPEEVDRLIDDKRQRAESYRRAGLGLLAWLCEQLAAQHARDHEKDFRTEAEREDAMIRAAAKRLVWHFAIRGDRLVADLVGEALGRVISQRRVCYLLTAR
jgi:hypothetical protein